MNLQINEIPVEYAKFKRLTAIGFALSIGFQIVFALILIPGFVPLNGQTKEGDLTSFGKRLEFTAKYLQFGIAWLLFCVYYAISKRATSPAIDPMNSHENLLELPKNVLTNSLEQFVMHFGVQLGLLSYLTSEYVLTVIPMLNLFFLIGRITYFLGYPKLRFFGFALTLLPTSLSVAYCIVKFFISHLF